MTLLVRACEVAGSFVGAAVFDYFLISTDQIALGRFGGRVTDRLWGVGRWSSLFGAKSVSHN